MRNIDLRERRKFNLKKDPVDPRDFRVSASPHLFDTHPEVPYVNLTEFCGPVKDQGDLGSCSAHSGTEAREFLYRKYHAKEANKDVPQAQFLTSPLFFYYMERDAEGTVNEDNGAYLSTCVKVMNKVGACLEKTDPYKVQDFKKPPTEPQLAEALKYTIGSYHRVDGGLPEIKSVLRAGYVINLGILLYASFEDNYTARTGVMLLPNKMKEKVIGGHAVLIVGYDDKRQALIVRNSWGVNWGDKGCFYMPYQLVDDPAVFMDAWVMSLDPVYTPEQPVKVEEPIKEEETPEETHE